MRRVLVFLVLIVLGCASTQRPSTIAKPDIFVRLPNAIFFGSGTTAPVSVDVEIVNRATVPLTVDRIELSSPSMVQYTLQTVQQTFREQLEPGASRSFTVFTTARALVSSPNEPLTVRVVATFEANGVTFREIQQQ